MEATTAATALVSKAAMTMILFSAVYKTTVGKAKSPMQVKKAVKGTKRHQPMHSTQQLSATETILLSKRKAGGSLKKAP